MTFEKLVEIHKILKLKNEKGYHFVSSRYFEQIKGVSESKVDLTLNPQVNQICGHDVIEMPDQKADYYIITDMFLARAYQLGSITEERLLEMTTPDEPTD